MRAREKQENDEKCRRLEEMVERLAEMVEHLTLLASADVHSESMDRSSGESTGNKADTSMPQQQ